MKTLPKYFVIKRIEHPLWGKYIGWANGEHGLHWSGNVNDYYGYDGNPLSNGFNTWNQLDSFEHNPTLITLEEWDECVNFKLPKKWCVKATEDNKYILHAWKVNNTKCSTFLDFNNYYMYEDGFCSMGKIKGYIELTLEQFKKHILKEETMKIIGYKLKKDCDKYVRAIQSISGFTPSYIYQSTNARGYIFGIKSLTHNKLKEAGVLDLWFEPVFDEPMTIYDEIETELKRAKDLHPYFPENIFEQLAVIHEELGEVAKGMNDRDSSSKIREELIQTAAMCVRTIENLKS